MVGIYTGPLPSIPGFEADGSIEAPYSDAVHAAFDEGLANNPTPRLLRDDARYIGTTGYVPEGDVPTPYQMPTMELPEPMLDPDTANARYGIKGNLSFDQPIPASVAQELYEHHRDSLFRQDVMARVVNPPKEAPPGYVPSPGDTTYQWTTGLGWKTKLATGFIASLLDPLNIAAAFIPVADKRR
jgi:hypothetical protein